jgi:hypothetical protein
MRVRISDEHCLDDLIVFLGHAGYRSHEAGPNEVVVAPSPSSTRLELLQLDLELRLRAWEAAHPGVTASQLDL